MSNFPDIPRSNEFAVPILKGTSPVEIREVVRRSMAAPGNRGLMGEAVAEVFKPSTEILIGSAYLWKEAHDTEPNPSWKDKIDWLRGKNLVRKWETGDLVDPDDPTLTQCFKFEDIKKTFIEMNQYDAKYALLPGFPASHRLYIRYGAQNFPREIHFSGSQQTREQMDNFATQRGGASFADFMSTNFTPTIESDRSDKLAEFSYSAIWDLENYRLTTNLAVFERYVRKYTSTDLSFDAGRGIFVRSWPGFDGREHAENAQNWGLPTSHKEDPLTFLNTLHAVLSIIPSELHGEE